MKRETTSNDTRMVSSAIVCSDMKAAKSVEFLMNDVFPTSGASIGGPDV